jgi:hypothetical protein
LLNCLRFLFQQQLVAPHGGGAEVPNKSEQSDDVISLSKLLKDDKSPSNDQDREYITLEVVDELDNI